MSLSASRKGGVAGISNYSPIPFKLNIRVTYAWSLSGSRKKLACWIIVIMLFFSTSLYFTSLSFSQKWHEASWSELAHDFCSRSLARQSLSVQLSRQATA